MDMRIHPAAIGLVLSAALLGCATPPPADTPSGASKHASMMDAMCKKHAAKHSDSGGSHGMMDKHCKTDAPADAASAAAHVH